MRQPLKSVPATAMKNRFGDFLGEIIHRKEPLLIERHGKPVAVLVSLEEWKKMRREEGEGLQQTPWIVECERLVEEIRKNHPRTKHTSSVKLIRSIREDEG